MYQQFCLMSILINIFILIHIFDPIFSFSQFKTNQFTISQIFYLYTFDQYNNPWLKKYHFLKHIQ